MTTEVVRAYEDAAQAYLAQFRALRDVPRALQSPTRGAAKLPTADLVERASEIADISTHMVPLAAEVLRSPDPILREGMSGQLLAQAAAEFQVAAELLQLPEAPEALGPTTRSVRGAQLRTAINALEQSMATPIDQGLPVAAPRMRAAAKDLTPDQAKEALQQAASVTVSAIARHVQDLGGDIALNLVLNTEWTAVLEGATLLRKDIGEKLDRVKEGVSAFLEKAVTTATKTLLNVYDKILVLMGKDLEAEARKKVREWLEKLKEKESIEIFDAMVNRLYKVDLFEESLAGWLSATGVTVDVLNQTATDVTALSNKFALLIERMSALETVMVLAKGIKIPQVLLVISATQIALLAVVVYAGFDYIGGEAPGFLNVTEGVSEIIQAQLGLRSKS
ncbi:MAG: hypothetical protein ACP5JG_17865 [Anaerolineae bacterium]